MDFQKAIKIKSLFNEFNQIRKERNYPKFTLSFEMFDLGKWSLDVVIPSDTCLYSRECFELFPLLFQLGLRFFIGFDDNNNIIFIQ